MSVTEARALYRGARYHKKQVRFHRAKAREYMERLEEFCRDNRIRLEVITKGEEETHGRTDSRPYPRSS